MMDWRFTGLCSADAEVKEAQEDEQRQRWNRSMFTEEAACWLPVPGTLIALARVIT
jgi:hypothetical protein